MITSAKNPKWANSEHTLIDLIVSHELYGDIPFSASPNDAELHGVDLFNAAMAGDFGTISPFVEPDKTPEQIIADLESAVQAHLNAQATSRGYDDIKSAALRSAYPGPFHGEGVAYAVWMDSCWEHCYRVLSDVQAGSRPLPTADELTAELPVLVLP